MMIIINMRTKLEGKGEKTEIEVANADGKVLVYWHKGANSGVWTYEDLETARGVAKELAKQEQVYEVKIFTTGSARVFAKEVS